MAYKSNTLTLSIIILTALTVTLILTTTTTKQKQQQQPQNPNTPICTFITPPSQQWSYNSRSFCHYPTACLSTTRTVTLHLPSTRPLCRHTTSTLIPYTAPFPCTPDNLTHITTAYSPTLHRAQPQPTTPLPLPRPPTIHYSNAVFVPMYPFTANIYHFANVLTQLAYILRRHSAPSFTVVFVGRENKLPWQRHFQNTLINAINNQEIRNLTVVYLPEYRSDMLCARDVILLGRRGHVNVWPFANTTKVSTDGAEIPVDSINTRQAFYKTYAINHQLPTPDDPTLAPPPLVLGYARRLGPGQSTGGNVHTIGTLRTFSTNDEIWFQHMLAQESKSLNITLRIFTTASNDSLAAQVSNFATLGAVVGIHGANLVNSIFMPPLSALIEIFPTAVTSQCYFAGANSGLRYIRFESEDPASASESGCFVGRCLVLNRQRRVKIGRERDRIRLRRAVRDGLMYLVELRTRFPNRVQLAQDLYRGLYQVVD